jgi:hypothetical protein
LAVLLVLLWVRYFHTFTSLLSWLWKQNISSYTKNCISHNTRSTEGNLESGVGARILGTVNDEWRDLGTWHLSDETPWGGPVGRAPLLGTLKDMLSKALDWASISIGVPLLGNMEGHSFLRAFEINRLSRDI